MWTRLRVSKYCKIICEYSRSLIFSCYSIIIYELLTDANPSDCRFGALKFDYTDPVPNFDRKLVHGVLAKLVTPRNLADCTALEAAAGGVVSASALPVISVEIEIYLENYGVTLDTKEDTNVYSLRCSLFAQLYNVVVENELVSRDLIKKGELQRRFTFIPLNKITRHTIEPECVRFAQHLVRVSLSFVCFQRLHFHNFFSLNTLLLLLVQY